MKFIVIGISDNPQPFFPPEVLDVIKNGKVFSGGKRHHDIVAPLLPKDAEWIDITVPLDAVFEQYGSLCRADSPSTGGGGGRLIIFASGDPLFFGFANTIRSRMPEANITVYPSFNSLQMLAHRLLMPYHDMHVVSLTGRPWPAFDRALIERTAKIGVLTDRHHTPAAIARHMLDYGYTNYQMNIGEHLGNPNEETVSTLSLEAAAQRTFASPNCLILTSCPLCSGGATAKPFGLPDARFALLDGREKMITKMPIRLLTLQALDLPRRHVFWDIGFCTGSVSIEARLLFPHLEIHAFEIRPECESIIHENARRFGAPGINVHIGDFLNTPLPSGEGPGVGLPDAVFIGGHGGRLKEIMSKVLTVLAPGGVIVFNSVSSPHVPADSRLLWDEACAALSLSQDPPLHVQLNDHNPIDILKAFR
ncbi:MAG: precorrin-6y C5,15-methyltransferase (decarboxylating) subunit CbiE [Prevotella sp.]|nr:precorrin-6y C5,15-methyltransferase (decarboxylating) subunit CbiE [Prevotella sp.]